MGLMKHVLLRAPSSFELELLRALMPRTERSTTATLWLSTRHHPRFSRAGHKAWTALTASTVYSCSSFAGMAMQYLSLVRMTAEALWGLTPQMPGKVFKDFVPLRGQALTALGVSESKCKSHDPLFQKRSRQHFFACTSRCGTLASKTRGSRLWLKSFDS
eukprot:539948-Amphidinium_carterae.1